MVVGLKKGKEILKMLRGQVDTTLWPVGHWEWRQVSGQGNQVDIDALHCDGENKGRDRLGR